MPKNSSNQENFSNKREVWLNPLKVSLNSKRKAECAMNPLVLKFADGSVFLGATALIALGSTLLFVSHKLPRFARQSLSFIILIALILAALSATPISSMIFGLWIGLSLLSFCLGLKLRSSSVEKEHWLKFAPLMTALFSVGLLAAEWAHRQTPIIPVIPGQSIVVIGDSLSASLSKEDRPWPMVLAQLSGLSVINLARPGATLESALKQVERAPTNCLIILEIGGNDLLGNANKSTFYQDLDKLLVNVCSRSPHVAMFELPLPPLGNGIGKAQRTLAKKHGVQLIPKHVLAHTLGSANGTVDGLHLSQTGHETLAQSIAALIKATGSAPR